MAGDLLVLAAKYVALTGEVEDLRRAMLTPLTNGAGEAARPTQPARSSGGSQHPNALKAGEAEARIMGLLRSSRRTGWERRRSRGWRTPRSTRRPAVEAHGYVTGLTMTQPPTVYEQLDFDPARSGASRRPTLPCRRRRLQAGLQHPNRRQRRFVFVLGIGHQFNCRQQFALQGRDKTAILQENFQP
jgi:hypothetical protein